MAGPVCFSQPWDVGVKGVGVTVAPVCPGLWGWGKLRHRDSVGWEGVALGLG